MYNTFVKIFWSPSWQGPLWVTFNLLSRQNDSFVLPELTERVTKLNTCDWEMVLLVFSEFSWMVKEKLPDPFHIWEVLEMLVLYFHYRVNLDNWFNWVRNRFTTSVIFWTIHKFTYPLVWGNTGEPEPEGVYWIILEDCWLRTNSPLSEQATLKTINVGNQVV